MLGQPIAAVAQPVDMAGELDSFQERVARGDALTHRRLIEDAEVKHAGKTTRAAPGLAHPLLMVWRFKIRRGRDDSCRANSEDPLAEAPQRAELDDDRRRDRRRLAGLPHRGADGADEA